MRTWWHIELFDGLKVRSGEVVITRFYSQRVGNLLAYLALYPRQTHAREVLAEQFWPDADPDASRLNLRVGLAALRRQLEPPGIPKGSVLIATRTTVGLNSERITTDVAEFEAVLQAADQASEPEEQIALLEKAAQIASGQLLPGCYEEWALAERQRLTELLADLLRRLQTVCEQRGERKRALEYAHRALALDPLCEESHCHLMRLYLAEGKPEAARRQYRELERILRESLAEVPSEAAQALAGQASVANVSLSPPPAPPTQSAPALPTQPASRRAETAALAERSLPRLPTPPAPRLPVLPSVFTRFFGREEEMEQVQRLLSPLRLPSLYGTTAPTEGRTPKIVTLTGPGGTGKTRLALEVGERVMDLFAGSALFVSLAEVTTASRTIEAILSVLPQERTANREAFEQVADTLSRQPTLLILDNFEQLLTEEEQARESTALIDRLRARCPQLTFLITSRQALGLEGEQEMALTPLPIPHHPGVPERLLEFAGVQLFVDRAQKARADFQVTPRNAAAVAALCDRLEGLPLALELAATWARILTPAQMLERLTARFDLLVSHRRDIPERHRTLRAAIDWSYQLLAPELQRCFVRLSIFRGGWSVEAAEAVCGDGETLQYLLALCERSLIVSEEVGEEERRFRMLETLREYATEQMSGEERNAVAAAHVGHFARLVQSANDRYPQPDAGFWMDRLENDHENLQAALDWALGGGAIDLGVEMVFQSDWFWFTRGFLEERLRRVEQVNALIESLNETMLPRALLWSAHFQPHPQARLLYERCLQLFRDRNDAGGIAGTLYALGSLAYVAGRHQEAKNLYAESLQIQQERGDQDGCNAVRAALAAVHRAEGDFSKARALLEELLTAQIQQGDGSGAAKVRVGVANIALEQGDFDTAAELLDASLTTYRKLGQRWGHADTLRNLGNVRSAQGAYDEGEAHLQESLRIFRSIEDSKMVGSLLLDLAEQAWERQEQSRLSVLMRECLQHTETSFEEESRVRLLSLQGLIALSEERTDAASTLFEEAERHLPKSGRSSALAWSRCHSARLSLARGETEEARIALQSALIIAHEMGLKPCRLRTPAIVAGWLAATGRAVEGIAILGAVASLSERLKIPPSPCESLSRERIRLALSAALGSEEVALAWKSGRELTLDDVGEQALKTLR